MSYQEEKSWKANKTVYRVNFPPRYNHLISELPLSDRAKEYLFNMDISQLCQLTEINEEAIEDLVIQEEIKRMLKGFGLDFEKSSITQVSIRRPQNFQYFETLFRSDSEDSVITLLGLIDYHRKTGLLEDIYIYFQMVQVHNGCLSTDLFLSSRPYCRPSLYEYKLFTIACYLGRYKDVSSIEIPKYVHDLSPLVYTLNNGLSGPSSKNTVLKIRFQTHTVTEISGLQKIRKPIHLSVVNCPHLLSIPDIPFLKSLTVEDCPNTSIECTHLQNLSSPSISGKHLKNNPSLHTLRTQNFSSSLIEDSRKYIRLKSLTLEIKSSSQISFLNFKHLKSLEELTITNMSLHHTLGKLFTRYPLPPNLKVLNLKGFRHHKGLINTSFQGKGISSFHARISKRRIFYGFGINNYQIKPLKNTINDIAVVGDVLKSNFGFEAHLYQNEEVTPRQLDEIFTELQNTCQKIDSVIVMFSGHGSKNGIVVSSEDQKKDVRVSKEQLQSWFKSINVKHFLFIADSCRSLGLAVRSRNAHGLSLQVQMLDSQESRHILSATGNETASDGKSILSPFSDSLSKALRGLKEPTPLSVLHTKIRELFVLNYPDERQVPHMSSMDNRLDGEIVFFP